MSNEIATTNFFGGQMANPADVANMASAMTAMGNAVPSAKSFVKMTKAGQWVHGAEDAVIDESQEFIVDAMSFKIGFVGWKGGKPIEDGEQLKPITDPNPVRLEDLPPIQSNDSDDGWAQTMQVNMKNTSGLTLVYNTSSRGGMTALGSLAGAIGSKASQGEDFTPVVTLSSTSYKHKKYGLTYNPSLNIQRFIDVSTLGSAPSQAEPESTVSTVGDADADGLI